MNALVEQTVCAPPKQGVRATLRLNSDLRWGITPREEERAATSKLEIGADRAPKAWEVVPSLRPSARAAPER